MHITQARTTIISLSEMNTITMGAQPQTHLHRHTDRPKGNESTNNSLCKTAKINNYDACTINQKYSRTQTQKPHVQTRY